jgi:hypothetical protein
VRERDTPRPGRLVAPVLSVVLAVLFAVGCGRRDGVGSEEVPAGHYRTPDASPFVKPSQRLATYHAPTNWPLRADVGGSFVRYAVVGVVTHEAEMTILDFDNEHLAGGSKRPESWLEGQNAIPPEAVGCMDNTAVVDGLAGVEPFFANAPREYTLHAPSGCLTSYYIPNRFGGLEGFYLKHSTHNMLRLDDVAGRTTKPRTLARGVRGVAALAGIPGDAKHVFVVDVDIFGNNALPRTIELQEAASASDRTPWGLAYRADGALALAGEGMLYLVDADATVARPFASLPSVTLAPAGPGERGCCDVAWLKDPRGTGAFLVAVDDTVYVFDDTTSDLMGSWQPEAPTPGHALHRIRSLRANANAGGLALVLETHSLANGEQRDEIVVLGFGLAGAVLGEPVSADYVPPLEPPAPP